MSTSQTFNSGFWAKVTRPIGFKKTYNFVLWFIFSGALLGFALARAPYLNFDIFCPKGKGINQLQAGPGECYWYTTFDRYYYGIRIHLFAIIFACFLVLFQFVPIIRYKAILFHRINGYLVVLLICISNGSALAICRQAFGGGFATQLWVGVVAIATTISLVLAWVNIKRLQIDQHRKWMLRTWFYLASIITSRLISASAWTIITEIGGFYFAVPCAKIAWIYKGAPVVGQLYPGCAAFLNGTNPDAHVAVEVNVNGGPEQFAAGTNYVFAGSLWLALVLHAVGLEIYLRLTQAESERLRRVSYERQLEKGLSKPGNSGLTVQRLGDADPWSPEIPRGVERGVLPVHSEKRTFNTDEERRESEMSGKTTP